MTNDFPRDVLWLQVKCQEIQWSCAHISDDWELIVALKFEATSWRVSVISIDFCRFDACVLLRPRWVACILQSRTRQDPWRSLSTFKSTQGTEDASDASRVQEVCKALPRKRYRNDRKELNTYKLIWSCTMRIVDHVGKSPIIPRLLLQDGDVGKKVSRWDPWACLMCNGLSPWHPSKEHIDLWYYIIGRWPVWVWLDWPLLVMTKMELD